MNSKLEHEKMTWRCNCVYIVRLVEGLLMTLKSTVWQVTQAEKKFVEVKVINVQKVKGITSTLCMASVMVQLCDVRGGKMLRLCPWKQKVWSKKCRKIYVIF